ncbi:hypothetical protein [Pseudoalteromonas sp. PS5]|uniref:hypothetical protein n=1 Tax=Pseudoalteromonas sp. PS5 TaxID=1437473 RepID=UPI000FFF028A|nr:hypothetical protein [Pseudoalteromonas sp. PS5]RXF03303.1 hypothetical protein D9603_08345 [Pseudoalteromonas sp. PS5]
MSVYENIIADLKTSFENVFPNWAEKFEQAQTAEQLYDVQNEMLLSLSSTDQPSNQGAIAITSEMFEKMNSAEGDEIETCCKQLLTLSAALKDLPPNPTSQQVTAVFIKHEVAAITNKMCEQLKKKLIKDEGKLTKQLMEEMIDELLADSEEVAEILDIVVATFIALVIPILWFFDKSAQCILYVVNNTGEDIKYLHRHDKHGKCLVYTSLIPGMVENKSAPNDSCRFAGLVSTSKKEGALIGTQAGFSFTINDPVTGEELNEFAIGIECPYSEKNCFSCAFNYSAEKISNDQSTSHGHSQTKTDKDYQLKVSLNSFEHSPAYFIAVLSKA